MEKEANMSAINSRENLPFLNGSKGGEIFPDLPKPQNKPRLLRRGKRKDFVMIKEDFPYHSIDLREVLKKLDTSKDGLSKEEVEERIKKYGLNEIKEKGKSHPLIVFSRQLNSFFIYVLILAGIISYFVGNLVDVYVIGGVILINSFIGFFQEYRAERSIDALKKMIVPYAKVHRDGEIEKVPVIEIVPGDIVLLEEGDRVPADCRLIEVNNFSAIESPLTGESLPSEKKLGVLKKDISLADRTNMVWMGTFVAGGMAKAVVVATNDNTAIGAIAKDIVKIKKERSHFQKKTDILAKQMGAIAIIGALLIFLIGFFIRGFEFAEILIFTMASLVSAIPEGLPAILIIVLAVGAFKMAKRKAIIRKLPATETLAVVNIIITDKTGTLTQNVMNVEKILFPGEEEISVYGNGWIPKGEFKQENNVIVPLENKVLDKLLHISAACNNSKLIKEIEEGKEKYGVLGDPTEASLRVLAEKAGLREEAVEKKIDEMLFDQKRKYRASLVQLNKESIGLKPEVFFKPQIWGDRPKGRGIEQNLSNKEKRQIYVMGAPEAVLKHCSDVFRINSSKRLGELDKNLIEKQINFLTGKAMRTIAFAFKEVEDNTEGISESMIEGLTYVGVVGIADPPRAGVKEAIAKARKAGIRVIMATGDHKNTAIAIAKEIGLDRKNSKDFPDAFTGDELEKMDENEFEKAVRNVNLFARLTPHMKLKIASTLQRGGHIIAMTGDGINDAPALKQSNIGIAMGVIGSDVARESAEIVLADDNFATIINAIEEGHVVFTNTRQTSFFLLTTNFAESITIIATMLIGLPLPLGPTQILWLNLVTDTGSGLGLAIEPSHNGIEEEKPKSPKENILTKEVIPFLILMSGMMVLLTTAVFIFFFSAGIEKARTGAFVVMAFTQLFNAINMRSLKKSAFKIGFFSNKYLIGLLGISLCLIIFVISVPFFQGLFQFVNLGFFEFLALFLLSSLVLWSGEAYKLLRR